MWKVDPLRVAGLATRPQEEAERRDASPVNFVCFTESPRSVNPNSTARENLCALIDADGNPFMLIARQMFTYDGMCEATMIPQ